MIQDDPDRLSTLYEDHIKVDILNDGWRKQAAAFGLYYT